MTIVSVMMSLGMAASILEVIYIADVEVVAAGFCLGTV